MSIKNRVEQLQKDLDAIKQELSRPKEEPLDQTDEGLLKRALEILSYATFHDGRYGQADNYQRFQLPAQHLVMDLAKRLNVEPYGSEA